MNIYYVYCKKDANGGLDIIRIRTRVNVEQEDMYELISYGYNYVRAINPNVTLANRDLSILRDRTEDKAGNYMIVVMDNNNKILNVSNHLGKYVKQDIYNKDYKDKFNLFFDAENMSDLQTSNGYIFIEGGTAVPFPGTDYIWIPVVED